MPPAGWTKSSKGQLRKGAVAIKVSCLFCGKVVRNYVGLEGHINSHIGERPYECSHCDATFYSSQTLFVHRNNIHFGKRFRCNICKKLFNVPSQLYVHRKKVHSYKAGQRTNRFVTSVVYSSIGGGRRRFGISGANNYNNGVRKRGRGRPIKTAPPPISFEESLRQAVEIESNPGTPLMTVNVLSRDAPVVTKLKAPVIRIQRLPHGVWKKQQMMNSSTTSNPPTQSETENEEEEEEDKSEAESEPENPETQFPKNEFPSSWPLALPTLPGGMLPHQMTPGLTLPPFSLAFPPFPFKLHNVTVPDNSNSQYSGLSQSQQQRWDPSFFLHLNRYSPQDSCYHADYPPKRIAPPTNPTRCGVQSKKRYVKRKCEMSKQRKKEKKCAGEEEICGVATTTTTTNSGSPTRLSVAEREELMEETESGVSCKECGKTFQIKWNLIAHLMTHTGEKPFVCHFCKMRFRQKAHMLKHIASIHRFQAEEKVKGKEDFSCGFCGHISPLKLDLIKHIKDSHNEMLHEAA